MRYRETHAGGPAAGLIDRLWFLEMESGPVQRIVPDGHPELILNLGQPFESLRNGVWQKQPENFLIGQLTGPIQIRPTGPARIMGIRFRPEGAAALIRLPMHELTGREVPLDALPPALRSLRDSLDRHAQPLDRLAQATVPQSDRQPPDPLACLLPDTLDRRLPDPLARLLTDPLDRRLPDSLDRLARDSQPDILVREAVRLIEARGGAVDLGRVASHLGLGIRQLERRFKHAVGMSPKLFCRIQRFQRVFQQLESGRGWIDAALACGYYDQAHLVRDFRDFSGEAPTALLESDELARHFLRYRAMSHFSKTAPSGQA